jgi:hypothetical protein
MSEARAVQGFGVVIVAVDVVSNRHDEFFEIAKDAAR